MRVETYSGYKADERPVRFWLNDNGYDVAAVIDQWFAPEATWFKVEADDGLRYILRLDANSGEWSLESLARSSPAPGSSPER